MKQKNILTLLKKFIRGIWKWTWRSRRKNQRTWEIIQNSWVWGDKIKNKEMRSESRDLWVTIMHTSTHIMGERRERGRNNIWRNNGWKLPKFEDKTCIYKSMNLNELLKETSKTPTQRHSILNLLKVKDKRI